jgi:CspA family cold shock protein
LRCNDNAVEPQNRTNPIKGFGFIVRDGGGKDVFVHTSALQRAGITGLNEGQRAFVGVAEGQKGPEAATVQLAIGAYRSKPASRCQHTIDIAEKRYNF